MKTKIITLTVLLMLLGADLVKADLVFDSGYNTFDDTDPYYDEVWVINDAHLDVLGGAMWKLELMNYATANIHGGDIDLLALNHNTVVNIYSGDRHFLSIQDSTVVNIHGGTLDYFAGGENGLAYLYAYDVTYHPTGGLAGEGWIEGIYISNDMPFSFSFYTGSSYSHINIIPEPTTRLVPDEYATIQAAIDDCVDGDAVIVAPGTYTGSGNRDIDFLGKAITVRSTDPDDPTIVASTIIDCNGTATNLHRGFYFHNNEDVNSILDGLTITNGYTRDGGAILCNQSSPTITNCVVNGNVAKQRYAYGGGIKCLSSSPTINNCTITENSAKGGFADGGGIYCYKSRPTITNCIISGNSAGDIGGGIYNRASSPTLINCIFSGNFAYTHGGGMRNWDYSDPTVINCTFVANVAGWDGGGIYSYRDSSPRITNCILWANRDRYGLGKRGQIYGGNPIVNYSCIQGWKIDSGGSGNISHDPLFLDVDGFDDILGTVDDNLRLLPDSPCIDAGDPNYGPEPNETDLDGKPRVIGGRIDMGAYEYRPPIPAEVRIVPRSINLASKGKWITASLWLGEEYDVAAIDPNSVLLEDEIEAESFRVDEQQQIAVARFSRSEVQGILAPGEVELTVSGELTDGTRFEGNDIIRVIDKGDKK